MNMTRKFVQIALTPVALTGLVFAGTAGTTYAASPNVTISFLNSKSQIETQLQQAATLFHKQYPNITINVSAVPQSGTPLQAVQALYASGNAPTIYMGDPSDVLQLTDKAVNLTHQPWVKDVNPNYMAPARTRSGQIYGFPFAIEGYGITYNVNVLNKAVGGKFNPKTITTRLALRNLLAKVKKSGVAGDYFAPMNWSLGGHFLGMMYADQSNSPAKVDQFIANLSKGRVNLSKNAVFNGLMNTFDLLESYNIQKASPLAGQYATAEADLATGKVGMFFQGDWIWPDLQTMKLNPNLGYLPVPISNNPKQYGNTQIPVGATKFLVINKVDNTAAQVAAAEKFLDWLALDKQGQRQLAINMSVIPPFKNNPFVPNNPLARSIESYMKSGKTSEFMVTLPSNQWLVNGNAMDKYMAGAQTRAQLAAVITNYWKTNKTN